MFSASPAVTALSLLLTYAVIAFDALPRVRSLSHFRAASSYVGAAYSYLCVAGAFAYSLAIGFDAFVIGVFFVIGAFHLYLHAKYGNYVSYFSVLAIAWYAYFKAFAPSPDSGFFPFLVFTFGLPAVSVSLSKFAKPIGHYDRHVLSGLGILHAFLFSGSYFFRFASYSVLEISLLSLGLSIILFFSYVSVRPDTKR